MWPESFYRETPRRHPTRADSRRHREQQHYQISICWSIPCSTQPPLIKNPRHLNSTWSRLFPVVGGASYIVFNFIFSPQRYLADKPWCAYNLKWGGSIHIFSFFFFNNSWSHSMTKVGVLLISFFCNPFRLYFLLICWVYRAFEAMTKQHVSQFAIIITKQCQFHVNRSKCLKSWYKIYHHSFLHAAQ